MRKYWFVTEHYWPVENSTGYIFTRIIDEFSKCNKANVLTVGNSIKERNENINTIRLNSFNCLDKNKLFQRFIKQILISILFLLNLLFRIKKNDVVFTVTNPAPIIFIVALIKKVKKVKLIILVHDVFPENLEVLNVLSSNSLFFKITKYIFNKSYSNADCLIVLGKDMKKTLSNKIKRDDNIFIIPNFADIDNIYPVDKSNNELLKKIGIVDKFVLLFTGNMGRMQGLELLMSAIKLLNKENDIHWLFIGNGAYERILQNKLKNNELKNVTILPNMPRDKSNIFLNAGDVGIVSLVSNINGTGVPSKTYTYMAAGKPILAIMDSDSEISQLVSENDIGWVVSSSKPEKLVKLILEIKSDIEDVKKKGDNARKICINHYSEQIITEQIVNRILITSNS